jgi:hypothetical protein
MNMALVLEEVNPCIYHGPSSGRGESMHLRYLKGFPQLLLRCVCVCIYIDTHSCVFYKIQFGVLACYNTCLFALTGALKILVRTLSGKIFFLSSAVAMGSF